MIPRGSTPVAPTWKRPFAGDVMFRAFLRGSSRVTALTGNLTPLGIGVLLVQTVQEVLKIGRLRLRDAKRRGVLAVSEQLFAERRRFVNNTLRSTTLRQNSEPRQLAVVVENPRGWRVSTCSTARGEMVVLWERGTTHVVLTNRTAAGKGEAHPSSFALPGGGAIGPPRSHVVLAVVYMVLRGRRPRLPRDRRTAY